MSLDIHYKNNNIMKKLFRIIFILHYLFIIPYLAPSHATDTFIIKNICFKGLQRISINTALSDLPFHSGDEIGNKEIAHAIKVLFSTGNFENIKISKEQDTIIIQVKERPLINNITFYGNKIIKRNILINNLKLQGIQEGKFFNQKNIFQVEKSLKNFYYNLGKYSATIKTVITYLPNNQINLKIIFNEGKSVNIKKINIVGNKKFSNNTLLNLFQLHNKTPRNNMFFKKKYQKNTFFHDLKSLQNFYFNRGFAKFNIDSAQINLTQDRKNVYLTIYITEGIQYKISHVFINGNLSYFSHEIHSLLKIYPNDLYNRQKIQNFTNNIKKFLGNNGYIKPNIVTEIETNDVNNTLILYVNINIGNRFYINKINFKGNTITNDPVLRREIRQMEKTWVNNSLINQSKERLNRIGYFENIKIKYEYVPITSDQLNITYEIKERNSGSMSLNLGIGTESGINFQGSIQQENLFGTGNSFILNASKNNYQTYTELSTYHPYISVNNLNLEEKIFYNNFSADNVDLADYALKSYGLNSSVGFPISEYNSLHFNLNYVHNDLNNIKPQITIWRYLNSQKIYPKIIPNLYPKEKTFDEICFSSNDLFFELNWRKNNLNHAYFPTYGSYINFSGKITIPGSSNEYYKITINSNHYIPLCQNSNYWILTNRIHVGYSSGLHKKENPFYDNFYSEGMNTVRGFRPNTIGPKAAYYKCSMQDKTYDTCTIENSQDAIGGNAITILKGELIIPPPFLNKKYANIIRTLIFVDLGTVWDTHWKNTSITRMANIPNYKKPTNIRISNGLAIQWMSPIGPITISYAKLTKRYAGDKLEQFQFNVGKTW